MNAVFDLLNSHNLLSRKGINISSIESLTKAEIIDLAESIAGVTQPSDIQHENSIFIHSASLALGGGREGCEDLEHRASRLNELARFAVMYSDKVYVNNFFSDYSHYKNLDDDELKETFYDDLYLLTLLKPLLQSESILLFTPPRGLCVHRWTNFLYGADASKRLTAEQRRLESEFLTTTSAVLKREDESFYIDMKGQKTFFEHGGLSVRHRKLPQELSSMPRIVSRVEKGEEIPLSQSIMKKLKLHKTYPGQVLNNVSYEISSSQILGASFLTENMAHISFLQSITNNQEVEKRNLIAQKYLTSFVPFAEDVEISKLAKLRKREAESFVLYRRALNEAISEFKMTGPEFSEKDARALYSDVIAPRLSTLEQRVKQAKRDLVSKAYRSTIAVTGAITFGLYAGFIPMEIAAFAKLIGFTKVATDILEKLLPLGDAVEAIKNDELYFLWKVKKSGKDNNRK